MGAHGDGSTESIVLADGRRLAYRRYGDVDSDRVVFNCHGGLLDGRDVAPAHAAAAELGVCIVSPDRSGVGGSDPSPGRVLLDSADDARELMDRLGIAECAAMGWSEGGQYALAMAYALPARVRRVAVIAGALPLDDPSHRDQLNRPDRRLADLAAHHPTLARAYFHTAHALAAHAPKVIASESARALDPSDRAVIDSHVEWFAESAAGATRNPAGAADEYCVFTAPWGFRPEDVSCPADVFQGTDDRLIAEAWGRELASRLPDARLHIYPGEGHFIAVTHRAEVIEALYPASDGSGQRTDRTRDHTRER